MKLSRLCKLFISTTIIVVTPIFAHSVFSQSLDQFELGLNGDLNLANGDPANDILGYSINGTYRLNSDWLIGARYGTASFDYERPSSDLNLTSTVVTDASADSDEISVFIERRYNERDRGLYLYWTAGVGINDVGVTTVSGTTTNGTNYLISTKVDTETLITGSLGQRYNFDNWSLGYGFRVEQRFGDWKVSDQVSGISKVAVDGYFVYGLFLETRFKF